MSKKDWGPKTWNFLHCLACHIKEENFVGYRSKLLEIVSNVCNNLPCPDCRNHAVLSMKNANTHLIQTKQDFINFIFMFHNRVNKSINKPEADKLILQRYQSMNIMDVTQKYIELANTKYQTNALIASSFHRKRFVDELFQFFKHNFDLFHVVYLV